MQTRAIGSLNVSTVGLGCNNFGGRIDADATERVVLAALDAGITFFDTADIYGGTLSEEYLGRALRERRDEAVVATKFGVPIDDDRKGGGSAAYVRTAAEDSLRRLGTDRIDLYQIHFPDAATAIGETLGALDELVRAGKVREIGCSNFSPEMLDDSSGVSRERALARFVSVQNEYSMLRRAPEYGVLEACARNDVAFIPYFPLANGLLTGKYRHDQPAPEGSRLANLPAERQADAFSQKNVTRVEALRGWADAHGHSLLELAFAWLLARREVASVIAGATKPEQARDNAAAASWVLREHELAEIDELLERAKQAPA